jgi:hypothetical protein
LQKLNFSNAAFQAPQKSIFGCLRTAKFADALRMRRACPKKSSVPVKTVLAI